MAGRRQFPIGEQDFANVRNRNLVYIDKTHLIYDIVHESGKYFFFRPRRFGKSLLLSTMRYYFEGRHELFEGLAIDSLETEWRKRPVIFLDLSRGRTIDLETLHSMINRNLAEYEQLYDIVPNKDDSYSTRLTAIIQEAHKQTGEQVVVLIDEYDAPMLDTMGDLELKKTVRNQVRDLYSPLKAQSQHLWFVFLTGITKFSQLSIFSELNNLTDISMDRRYVEICGITEEEIHDNFDDEVGELSDQYSITKEQCYARLKDMYDGYHFRPDSIGIYNPFSLLNALDKLEFRYFWFESGTPSALVETMQRNNYPLEHLTSEEVSSQLMSSVDSDEVSPIPLIYQSGYMTIKGFNEEFGTYQLGFPNKEVSEGFTKFLLPYYSPVSRGQEASFVSNFVKEVREGKPEAFMERLEALFASGNYQIIGDEEKYFHNAIYIIFKMLGIYVDVEHATTDGRIDLLMKTKDYIYIMEFKIDKSAEAALAQIEDKQYAKPFEADGRTIYKIGVNFSTKTRRIDGWICENDL
jgi:hypothetical protein